MIMMQEHMSIPYEICNLRDPEQEVTKLDINQSRCVRLHWKGSKDPFHNEHIIL